MKNILILFFALFLISASRPLATPANVKGKVKIPKHVSSYINRFLSTAKAEADKYNIPVSITLAQGIIESNAGRSELSRKHNNHFGMKWKGKGKYAVYKDDSPKDRFQVFKSAWRSYRAHSELLTCDRYKHLLKLDRMEYRKWAKGLKKAGYATNPKYAEALIAIIERYGLWVYDVRFLNY
jgi:flagellum-specific peptidoglycan hydrolase FlgJ